MELGTTRRETILVVDDNCAITTLVKSFWSLKDTRAHSRRRRGCDQLYQDNQPPWRCCSQMW
jgi:hypothetical protein